MAVAEQEETRSSGPGRSTALKAAAAAAATGAATLAARKAFSHDDSSDRSSRDDSGKRRGSGGGDSSVMSSAAASAWDAASGVLLPFAEDLAESAGKYVAQNAPDVIRERIVPRFIEAFNEAS